MSKLKPHEPEGFPEFWTVWRPVMRHTDGKGLAREAFRKQVLNGVDPQDIIDGAAWFIRNLKERDREFVPLSQTWLNRECFDGLCDRERDFQKSLTERTERASNVTPMIQPRKSAILLEWEEMQKAKQREA